MKNRIPKVIIIILNFNSWQHTIECLESLYKIKYSNYGVILIDNGSKDDSIEKIREYAAGKLKIKSDFFDYNKTNKPIEIIEYTKDQVQDLNFINNFNEKALILIKNDKNYGFTKGNNIGIQYTLKHYPSDYILLLNNDTIVDENFLNEMINVAESVNSIGFVGAKTYYYKCQPSLLLKKFLHIRHPLNHFYKCNCKIENCKTVIQSVGCKQNLWTGNSSLISSMQIDKGQFNEDKIVDFIHGSCMLTKIEMIKEIGVLDKNFFSYREENDWCLRGKEHDWESVVSHRAVIWHKGKGSTGGGNFRPLSEYYMTKNKFILMKKHSTALQKTFFLMYFFVYQFWFMMFIYFTRPFPNKPQVIKCFFRSVKDGLKVITK